ncbi:hypothetical protein GOP47_0029826 [Adiantum capillus-veneris]|nr:hypothetical protein GOP47_0029826 [Adiantum capillus-veneris]
MVLNSSSLVENFRLCIGRAWRPRHLRYACPMMGLVLTCIVEMVTVDDEGYESDEETSSCSDGGESFDDELRSFILAKLKDKEAIHQSVRALEVKAEFEMSDSETRAPLTYHQVEMTWKLCMRRKMV